MRHCAGVWSRDTDPDRQGALRRGQRRALAQRPFDGAPGEPGQHRHDETEKEQDRRRDTAQDRLDRQGERFQGDTGGDERQRGAFTARRPEVQPAL
jgi:hypothetical protein